MQHLSEDERKRIGRFGPYTPIAHLGYGGMGIVYLGKHLDGSLAAVKVITPLHADNAEAKNRFRQEITNSKRVSSPFVGKIIAEELGDERWWYASEYVPGLNLAQAVQQAGGRLPTRTVTKLIHFIALGLQAIHAKGIVHRDLKPQNIMISPDGVKIIDFGIAYTNEDPHLTNTNEVVGTPAYMCVEQMRKETPAAAWDIFALGNVITYMLTGKTAYNLGKDGPHAIRMNILNGKRDLTQVPQEFLKLVETCLSPNAYDRPQAGRIHEFLGHEPTAAMPKTLFLPDAVQTAILRQDMESNVTALRIQALRPIPKPRNPGESNTSWERRNQTYINEMKIWSRAEFKRRWKARWTVFRKKGPKVVLAIVVLAVFFTAGMLMPNKPAWLDDLKRHVPEIPGTAEAAPNPGEGPKYQSPKVTFTDGAFKANANPGSTRDPDAKDSSITVNKIEASGRQVKVFVTVTGFNGHNDAPFAESCVTVKGRNTITVQPTSYVANGEDGSTRTGTITYSMAFQGAYTLHPECNQDKSVPGVHLGNAGAVNFGTIKHHTTVVPIMGKRQDGNNLVLSVISGGNESSQFCMRSNGAYKRPSQVAQVKVGDIPMSELTFNNTRGGTLYTSCSERSHRVTPNGSGVKVS